MIIFWLILIFLLLGLIVISVIDEGPKRAIKSWIETFKEVLGEPLKIFLAFCVIVLLGIIVIGLIVLFLLN